MSEYVVWKYQLTPTTPSVVHMPKYAAILHVGHQDDGPVLWALVDSEQPLIRREFWVYGTGHPIDTTGVQKHIGTVQTESGLVWHVFEQDELAETVQGIFGSLEAARAALAESEAPE